MAINIIVPEVTSHANVALALQRTEGFREIMADFPEAAVTLDIGDTLIGYRFHFSVAGRKNKQTAHFWGGYQPGRSLDNVERTLRETGERLLPILARIALHQDAIAKNEIPASDIKAPKLFRALLDQAGISGVEFLAAIGNKTTSWSDGASSLGRKVKRLPLSLLTAGEFKNDELKLLGLQAPSGARIDFIHDGGTPIYEFQGKLPDIISDPLLGEPISAMVEAPELEPFAEYLRIKKFDYPSYGSSRAELTPNTNTYLGDAEPQLAVITARIKARLEDWLGLTLDEPEKLSEDA